MQRQEPVASAGFLAAQLHGSWSRSSAVGVGRQATYIRLPVARLGWNHRPVKLSWANLLKRVFEIDIGHCPNCGSGLKIIAPILEAPVIQKILTRLGL